MKKTMIAAVLALGLVLMSLPVLATPLSVFTGWTQIADDDGVGDNGYVDPGWGGQAFDAEYLFYKYESTSGILSVGLQTGFDVVTGAQGNYYAGDLALSFDGCKSCWEYGVEFGFTGQAGYYNGATSYFDPGLYEVTKWNNDVYFHVSDPFAIETVNSPMVASITTLYGSGNSTDSLTGVVGLSYWRTASFSVAGITGFDPDNVDAHWTMSCGNDVIESCSPVPEPQTLLLMGIGLLGLAFIGRKKIGDRA